MDCPKMLRLNVVRYCHDGQGHFGLEKTLSILRENYWFKCMRKFISKYVRSCLNCLYYKSSSCRKPGWLHPIEKVTVPFHTMHLDHVEPFIRSPRRIPRFLSLLMGLRSFACSNQSRTRP